MTDINSYKEYKIKRETMTHIADKLRVVVGKKTLLTPEEIAYYIDRIIFTPQSYATSSLKLSTAKWQTRSLGILPEVHRTKGETNFIINTIYGESFGNIPEVHKAQAISSFNLVTIFN